MHASERLVFGNFVLDRSQRRVLRADGSELRLTPRLFNALLLFVEHAGELLDKDMLMQALWPGLVVEENNLNQVVAGLRRSLGGDDQGSRFIETVPRVGFRFVAPVTREAAADDPVPALPAPEPPAGGPAPSAIENATGTGRQQGRRRGLLLAAAGAAAAGLGGLAWWRAQHARVPAPRAGVTLAVLPFKPLDAETRDELLELGMADSLIARLSLVPGWVVRSTGSVRRYAGNDQDPLRAASELDVAWIVDGSLQRRGEQLRVTARLLRASDGSAAWSGTFDERFTSVFDLQDTISDRVAQVLEPRLTKDTPGRYAAGEVGGTRNTDAYQLYLAALRHAALLRGDGLRKAVTLYQEALAIDPDYALAWVGLAVAHRRSFIAMDARPATIFEAATPPVERALAIASHLAEALVERAYKLYWFDYDWPAAEAVFRRAITLNPNVALARFGLATLLLNQDRLPEGFAQLKTARELDPLSPLINALEANYLFEAGSLPEARARLRRAFDIAPAFWLAHDVHGLMLLAEGQPEKALAAMQHAVELAGGSTRAMALLGAHLARQGQERAAREVLAQLQTLERSRYVPGTSLATVHASLGEVAPALDALERAYRDRDTRLVFLKDDPLLAGLRSQPRFQALLRRLKLDGYGPGLAPM